MSTSQDSETGLKMDEGQLPQQQQGSGTKKMKEIYTYDLPWMGNAMSWSVRCDKPFRLAVASYMEGVHCFSFLLYCTRSSYTVKGILSSHQNVTKKKQNTKIG